MPVRKPLGSKKHGGLRFQYPKEVADSITRLIGRVRTAKQKRVVMDTVFSGIYEKTGIIIDPDHLAQTLRKANSEVEIIWGEIRSSTKGYENIELSCRAILVAKKLNLREARMKFKDDWPNALENHFRENGRFPTYNSFRKGHFGTINRQGLERIRKQIIKHYWELLENERGD